MYSNFPFPCQNFKLQASHKLNSNIIIAWYEIQYNILLTFFPYHWYQTICFHAVVEGTKCLINRSQYSCILMKVITKLMKKNTTVTIHERNMLWCKTSPEQVLMILWNGLIIIIIVCLLVNISNKNLTLSKWWKWW